VADSNGTTVLKRLRAFLRVPVLNSWTIRFTVPGAVLLTAFLSLHLVSCNGSSPTTQIPPPPPPPPGTAGTNVTTYHNDNARSGQNLSETILTATNVNSSSFGKLFVISVDGRVDAQPLYLTQVSIPNQGTHNVLYVGTEHGSVYGFDADTGKSLWQVSMLASGETTSDDHGCSQITPEIGVTATPVIDPKAGPHGTIYVVAMSRDGTGTYHQRLHALDVTTGAEEFGGPQNIQASFPGTGDNSSGGNVVFAPGQYAERAGLLLLNGVVYTGWTSHCDIRPYTGWIMGFDQSTLAQVSVLNLTPNGSEGSVWMSGAGLAADSSGNIFLLDANGTFDTALDANGFPGQGDFGNAFLKISTASQRLAVADYFEMFNQSAENDSDQDLGSGGALVLPDLTDGSGKTRHLAVGAGKDSNIYVVDRDAMGKFNPSKNNIYQQIQGALSGSVFSMPAYFNNTVYYGSVGDNIKAFAISNAQLANSPASQTGNAFGYPGATPSISANGTSNAILWAAENGGGAVLHAYDATNLSHELYNSNQAAGGRDQFGSGNKFITPMITNGKVYVGTTNGVGVFGLLQ
jgi:outer membrane protein assembly factor BamB